MKSKIRVYVLFTIILVSCNIDKSNSYMNCEAFSIDIDSLNQGLKQDPLIDSVLYIPLETHPNGLITSIEKILYSDNKFFILDQINRDGILVFSDEGAFITKIGSIGRGPSEYINLSNFDVYDNKVYIYDNLSEQIKVYNFIGGFIEKFKIPDIQYDFSIIDSTRILQFWAGSPEKKWKQAIIYDWINEKYSNYIPIHGAYNGKIHAAPYYEFSQHLFRSGETILFNNYFSNIIYKSSNDSLIPYLCIKSNALIKHKDIKRLIGNNYKRGEKIAHENIINITDIFQSENLLTFSIKNKNPLNIVYNIKTNNFKDYSKSWQNQKLIDINKIFGVKNNMFLSIIPPQLFQEKGNFNNVYLKYFIHTKHSKELISNGDNSNPVIVIFNFKEF